MKFAILLSLIPITNSAAFIPSGLPVAWGQETALKFGFNGLGSPKSDEPEKEEKKEKKISAGGLIQLITAGMGAPFLGDFEGVDEVSAFISFSYLTIETC